MSDLESHGAFTGEYSGLLTSVYLTVGAGGICLIAFETLRHVSRRRGKQGAPPHSKGRRIKTLSPDQHPHDESLSRPKSKAFSWDYWRIGRHEKDPMATGDEVYELCERNRKGGFDRTIGKQGFTNDRQTRVGLVKRILGSRESWEFAYLFENRCWNAIHPAEPMPRWPLVWIYSVLVFPERDLVRRAGLDCASHSRFLRGSCE